MNLHQTPGHGRRLGLRRGTALTGLLLTLLLTLAACGAQTDAPSSQASIVVTAQAAAAPQAALQTVNRADPALANVGASALDLSLEERLIQLYRQANPAVVYVIAAPIGTGSGFVYDTAGHIVTNNHVVNGATNLEVVFASGERRVASVVGADVDGDLAVIQVDALPADVSPLPLAAAEDVAVGQFVVAIGNPFGEQGSMSLGIVSGLGRSLPSGRATRGGSTYSLPAVIQTDAPINPGNSGGPLLNLNGEVVGVNAAIESGTGANSGVGFSIPAAAVQRIVPNLIAAGRYTYPYIGAGFDDEVSLAEQELYRLPQTQGAYVVSLAPGGPAAAAGLAAADPNTGRGGDLIVAIDSLPIGDFQDLNRYLVLYATPGQTIQMTVMRGGSTLTVPVTLAERP